MELEKIKTSSAYPLNLNEIYYSEKPILFDVVHYCYDKVKLFIEYSLDQTNSKQSVNEILDINIRDELGNTVLNLAVPEGDIKIIELLLENGADPNIGNRGSYTPLHGAAEVSGVEIARLLLNCKNKPANPNAIIPYEGGRGFANIAPIHYAVLNRNLEFVQLLVEHRADVSLKMTNQNLSSHPSHTIERMWGNDEGAAKLAEKIKKAPGIEQASSFSSSALPSLERSVETIEDLSVLFEQNFSLENTNSTSSVNNKKLNKTCSITTSIIHTGSVTKVKQDNWVNRVSPMQDLPEQHIKPSSSISSRYGTAYEERVSLNESSNYHDKNSRSSHAYIREGKAKEGQALPKKKPLTNNHYNVHSSNTEKHLQEILNARTKKQLELSATPSKS
jgi:ankyrin repeat protein